MFLYTFLLVKLKIWYFKYYYKLYCQDFLKGS